MTQNEHNEFERIVPQELFQSGQLRVIICYALAAVNQPVPATELSQLLHYNNVANYFDVQTAFSELERDGLLVTQKDFLTLTEQGRSAAHTLRETVSAPLRKKLYNAVVKMLGRYRSEHDTSVELTPNAHGCLLSYRVQSEGCNLLAFQIQLPNEQQARALKEKISADPKYYGDMLIRLLTENHENVAGGTQNESNWR